LVGALVGAFVKGLVGATGAFIGETAVGVEATAVGAGTTGATGAAGATAGLSRLHRSMSNLRNLHRTSLRNNASDGMGARVNTVTRKTEDRRIDNILWLRASYGIEHREP
jgi:hypothetical protein